MNVSATGLRYIYFGAGVKNIPESFFYPSINSPEFRDLEKIEVSPENKYYCSVDGVLFTKDMKTLIKYPKHKKDNFYKIPNTVTTIFRGAFFGAVNLKKIDLGSSLVKIEKHAFCKCINLVKFKIPKTLKFIGAYSMYLSPIGVIQEKESDLEIKKIKIDYSGTKEEWNLISKEYCWIDGVGVFKDGICLLDENKNCILKPYCNIIYNSK